MNQVNEKPTARLAVKRNVLKMYNVDGKDVYFLKNGTEFEIELFNPTNTSILCKIEFNGINALGSTGIVLRPGERVFLERYLDTNNKFKFDTYEVEDTKEVKKAIANNGLVRIEFFDEARFVTYTDNTVYWVSQPNIYNTFYTSPVLGVSTKFASQTSSSIDINYAENFTTNSSVETGRVEKGGQSTQNFAYVDQRFNSYVSHIVLFQILPDSQKLVSSDDFKHKKYCSECGSKIKHTDKYCSNCGTKL